MAFALHLHDLQVLALGDLEHLLYLRINRKDLTLLGLRTFSRVKAVFNLYWELLCWLATISPGIRCFCCHTTMDDATVGGVQTLATRRRRAEKVQIISIL